MMTRFLTVLFAVVATFVLPAHAAEAGAERLKGDYDAALEVTYPDTPGLVLRDALLRLQAKPDSAIDVEPVRQAVIKGTDAALTPVLMAIVTLNAAATPDLAGYRGGLARLRETTEDARILRLADVSDALIVCRECRGNLRCDTCRGNLKCNACKGRGFIIRRNQGANFRASDDSRTLGGSSLRSGASSASALRVRCTACEGTGRCPKCHGTPKRCAVCGTSGKVPDPAKARERVAQLANEAADHLTKTLADEIAAREQTGLLAEDVRKARGIADPKEALDFLASLPPERVKAAQWSQVAVVRADLEAIVKAREATSAEKVSERTALREAVRLAQQKADPIQGMEALLKVFDSFADCDALPEAKTAFDGLVAAAQAAQRMRVEALGDRIATIAAISDPADKLAQVQACLSDWPEKRTSKALLAYAKANRHTALERLLEDDALDTLRARIERLRKEAEQVQTEAAEKPAWWVWVAIGVGALAVLYVVASALQSFLAARAEAKRKAANRAAIDSIRNTFAHRRGQR